MEILPRRTENDEELKRHIIEEKGVFSWGFVFRIDVVDGVGARSFNTLYSR